MHANRSIRWRRLALMLVLLWPVCAGAQVRSLSTTAHGGKRYVALKDLAGMYGLPLTAGSGKRLLIRGQYIHLQFEQKSRTAVVNGVKTWLHAPVTLLRGQWHLSDADAKYIIDPLVRPSAYLGARATRTVVLDPGHGGKDPGALSIHGLQEKDLVLDIARRVRAHLRVNGIRVVMTRDSDRFWTLKDRPYLAARGGGDVFVSIHLNATGTRSVSGVETFVMTAEHYPSTSDGRLTGKHPTRPNNRFNHSNSVLGHEIQKSLTGITRTVDRGLKRARFAVLKNTAMPSALVECGFLTNPQEEQKLSTPSYRETVAQGIARGILNYVALVNRAKVEMGAPLIQSPTRVASPAPAAPSPIPMASRAWVTPPPGTPLAASPGAASVNPESLPLQAPAGAPAAPEPVAAAAPPAVAVSTAEAPALRIPAPAPASAPAVRRAVAAPPSMLLNPSLNDAE